MTGRPEGHHRAAARVGAARSPAPHVSPRRIEGARVGELVAVVVVAFCAWVWASGEVAGLLADGRWPPVPLAEAPVIALGLVADPGHARRAWPAAVRDGLPTGPLLAVSAVLLAAGAVAALALGVAAARRFAPGRSLPRRCFPRRAGQGLAVPPPGATRWRRAAGPAGAHWASAADLRTLQVRGATPGRVVLGRIGRNLVATESRHSVLVFGPTQSGKTTSLALPALLEWDGPVVATSVKDDLVQASHAWRAGLGRCWVFDPTGVSGTSPGDGWSPLGEAGTWGGAQRVASWMVDATPARDGMSDGGFWYAAAAKLLAPLLLAARSGQLGMAEVVRWVDAGAWSEPAALLETAGHDAAVIALDACAARDPRIASSVGTTLETVLAPFADPVVARRTAALDIDPAVLVAGCHSLYLCGPAHEQARVQGLFASLVAAVVAAAVTRAGATGGRLDPPLLLVLDEVANIAPLRDLDTLASTGASLGIQLVTVCQDLAQLAHRYGAERSRTIANNHRAKLALPGVSDLSTLDLLSGLAGEQAVREVSVTDDLRDGRRTRSSSTTFRRLAPADELRRTRPGEATLVYGHLPPARLRLRPWYSDPELRARAGGAARASGQCDVGPAGA